MNVDSLNIDPKIWGPSSWNFMHYITIGYPERPNDEIKKNTYNFFMSLKYLLPCEKCRYNFNRHLEKYPLTNDILSSKDKLIDWLIQIHNEVNISTGKPAMARNQIMETFMNPIQYPNSICNIIDSRILTIIITITLIIIILIVLRFCR